VADVDQTATGSGLRARREAVVREHMESENRHDFDATIGTFAHPRYEIVATGEVFDGEQEVRRYFAETRAAFPDQRNELIALHPHRRRRGRRVHLLGTHLGSLRGLAPTGRSFRCRMSAFFIFEGERLACERVYFDQSTILRQLGLAHAPASMAGRISVLISHPLTVGRALLRSRGNRRGAAGA